MRDFTKGNIVNGLVSFSLPIIFGDLLQSVYLLVDAIWVGRLVGHLGLAAVAASTPLIFFLTALIIGLGISSNILAAQAYGAGKKDLLGSVLTSSFLSIIFFCLIISFGSIFASRFLLKIVHTPADIVVDARRYFVIIIAGFIFTALYKWVTMILRALGDSITPLMLLVFSVVLNIILTPLLIIGAGPLPAMGVAGSAMATVVSAGITLFAGYGYLVRKNPLLGFHRRPFSLDLSIIRRLFTIGIPVSLHMVIISLSHVFIIALVNRFGPEVTAAFGIGVRLDQFAFLPALSMGVAVSSMTAQNLGARRYERIPSILKWATLLSLSFSFLLFLAVNIAPRQIAAAFTGNAAVVFYTQRYFRVVGFSYLVFSAVFSLNGLLRGAGDTVYQLIFSIVSIIAVRIPLAFFLSRNSVLQETGIWAAILISAAVVLFLNYGYYLSGRWKQAGILSGRLPAAKAMVVSEK